MWVNIWVLLILVTPGLWLMEASSWHKLCDPSIHGTEIWWTYVTLNSSLRKWHSSLLLSFCCPKQVILPLKSVEKYTFPCPKKDEERVRVINTTMPCDVECVVQYPLMLLVWALLSLFWGFPCDSAGKDLPAMWETWVRSLGWEDPLEKGRLPAPVFWPGVHGVTKSPDRTERFSHHT